MKTLEQKQSHADYMRNFYRDIETPEAKELRLSKNRTYRSRPQYKTQRIKYDNKYNKNNLEKVRKSKRDWNHNNPEKRLEMNIRVIQKFSLPLDKSIKEVRSGLYNWRKCVLKRDYNLCQTSIQPQDQKLINSITGLNSVIPSETKASNSHHILFKSDYPQLAFNLNNGISISEKEHTELHILNDVRMKI